jgi:hypothetical protein
LRKCLDERILRELAVSVMFVSWPNTPHATSHPVTVADAALSFPYPITEVFAADLALR